MNRRRSVSRGRGRARIIGALGLALAWLGAGVCQAGGQVTLPPVNLGSSSFLDGRAGPGWFVQEILSYYSAPRFTNADGHALSRPDGIVVAAAVTHVAFLSNRTLLGAHVGAELLVPVVSFDLDVAPALQDGGTGIGDLVLGPLLLQWNGHSLFGRPLHHRLGINVTLPTGRHDGRRAGNVGHGTWQFNPHWAFTSMVSSRWEFSGRMHYLWVSESHDLPASLGAKTTQAGQAAHSNFALSYALTNGLRVGAAGYVLKQVTDHRIDGVDQAGSREQVIGLGPGLSWRVGGSTLFANVYLETAVRNRPKGARFFLRWSRPF